MEISGSMEDGGVLAQVYGVSSEDYRLEEVQLLKDLFLVVVLGMFFDVRKHGSSKFRKIILQPYVK